MGEEGALHWQTSIGVSVEVFALAEKNSVAMATQCLLYQAKSLGGRIISEMPGMGKFRGLPGHRPWSNQ